VKHWGLNTQGVFGKQDAPVNNSRTNQQEINYKGLQNMAQSKK